MSPTELSYPTTAVPASSNTAKAQEKKKHKIKYMKRPLKISRKRKMKKKNGRKE